MCTRIIKNLNLKEEVGMDKSKETSLTSYTQVDKSDLQVYPYF